MCGIAGFHVKDPKVIKKHEGVELLVDELLKGIEHRGKHATGFVAVGFDGKVTLDKAPKEASEFIKDRERIPENVRTVLLHTRYATLGSKDNQENNHPVVYGSCFATHNGHINNHAEVYEELDLIRNAEVDSSVIAAAANYHGIGELDDIRSTLEALEGSMACAIINPVTHPGRVVLAKGSMNPLYVVDTPKFIVWASTMATIKEAWGKVLGTPPNDKKIESITEGNFIVIDDGDVTRDKFTVKRRPFLSRSIQGPIQRNNGHKPGQSGSGFGFGKHRQVTSEEVTPVVQARDAIAEFIKAGGVARTFDQHQNGAYAEDDFKDVVGERKWHPCYGCNRLVLEEDRVKSDWGTICGDCYTATKREIARAGAEMQDKEWVEDDVLAGTTIPRITPGDRDALEVWADHELTLHREVIDELSKACGSYYSPQSIEFLCFYTTPEYREVAGEAVNNLITELRDAYEEAYLDIVSQTWEGAEGAACEVPEKPALLEAGSISWGFCMEHNRSYQRPQGCASCDEEARMEGEARLAALLDHGSEDEPSEEATTPSTEIGVYLPFERGRESVITRSVHSYSRSSDGTSDSTDGDAADDEGSKVIDLPRCGKCKTFVLRASEDGCVVCRESEANDGEHAPASASAACVTCTSPDPTFVVGYAGRNYYYCRACYGKCGKLIRPDAKDHHVVRLCGEATNHMLKDGVRVCHQHARCQSEALSDTTLRKRGATITEV